MMETVKRSSNFEDFNSKNTNAFSKDQHDHDPKSNSNIVSKFNIPSETNCNDIQGLTIYPKSEIVSDFNNTCPIIWHLILL